jgi:sulfite reductase alpha subunit-like flavoprotein
MSKDSFWEKLTNKEVNYEVFGLRNNTFTNYNVMAKLLDYIFSKHMKSLCPIGLGDDNWNIIDNCTKWKDEIFFPALDKFIY